MMLAKRSGDRVEFFVSINPDRINVSDEYIISKLNMPALILVSDILERPMNLSCGNKAATVTDLLLNEAR